MAQAWTVPKLWKGERVFIIAGGQSVPRQWLSENRLPDRIIAVKDAALVRPMADLLFYAGRRFHLERPEVWAAYMGPMRVKRTVDQGVPHGVQQVHRLMPDKAGIAGLSQDPTRVGGFCSGGSALNLAYLLGAREIVLIGYDLTGHHWNPSHPFPRARMDVHARHRRSIDAMAAPLKAAGVKVVNTSPMSRLEEYPHADLASVI